MAEDIVKQLRSVDVSWTYEGELCAWAADHIEKLEAALNAIHYYVDASNEELKKDKITRSDALLKARILRSKLET